MIGLSGDQPEKGRVWRDRDGVTWTIRKNETLWLETYPGTSASHPSRGLISSSDQETFGAPADSGRPLAGFSNEELQSMVDERPTL